MLKALRIGDCFKIHWPPVSVQLDPECLLEEIPYLHWVWNMMELSCPALPEIIGGLAPLAGSGFPLPDAGIAITV